MARTTTFTRWQYLRLSKQKYIWLTLWLFSTWSWVFASLTVSLVCKESQCSHIRVNERFLGCGASKTSHPASDFLFLANCTPLNIMWHDSFHSTFCSKGTFKTELKGTLWTIGESINCYNHSERSMKVPPKIKNKTTIKIQQSRFWVYIQRK